MAHKQHNPADDFEAMLRQHLKRGGAPVALCAGFDADTASAYVERALSAPARFQFETHLAGCAACRCHVVALARLSDTLAPAPVAAPVVPFQVAEPFWTRWPNAVAQWFDLSAWHLGWTAATGTACAVLFAALGAGLWWRAQAPQAEQAAGMAAIRSDALVGQAAGAGGTTAPMVTSLNNATNPVLAAASQDKRFVIAPLASGTPQANLPAPEAAPAASAAIPRPATTPNFPVTNSLVAITTNTPELRSLAVAPSAPTVGAPSAPPPVFNLPASAISFSHLNSNPPASGMLPVRLGNEVPVRSSAQIVLLPGEPEQKELVNELLLPGARRNRAREEASTKAEAGKTASNRELLKTLKGRTLGFMPTKDTDKEAKNIDARTKEADLKEAQEQLKPLMKRLNGHVFYFDHGFWIDEEYTSETKLPIKRLQRGSQEYQQILIQNPSLEQFFQLGQVIVVWKGVVYEVRK